jgi:tetratricopeptide (TPR) repeat protein
MSAAAPLPSTVPEKISFATALKNEGNEFFKAAEYKKAAKCYKKVLLYINGLHGSDSQMKGFMQAMGASSRWDDTDDNVKVGGTEDEEAIKKLKVDVNANLSMAYLKLEDWSKALQYADASLAVDPTSSKSIYRKGLALHNLQRNDQALPLLVQANEADPSNKSIARTLQVVRKAMKEKAKGDKQKEKEMFSGAFGS